MNRPTLVAPGSGGNQTGSLGHDRPVHRILDGDDGKAVAVRVHIVGEERGRALHQRRLVAGLELAVIHGIGSIVHPVHRQRHRLDRALER